MKTLDFTTTITVNNTAEEVYKAINNVRAWWSEEVEGSTDQLNEEWNYHYQDVHRCTMKTITLIPNQKVAWEVIHNHFSFTKNSTEWIGNTLVFDITVQGNETHLKFTQIGLVSEYECYDICENAWNTYIRQSLYKLITTGTGQPNGKDNPQTDDEKALGSTGFTTTFFVSQTPQQVFEAINNVRGWWQGQLEGDFNKTGDVFMYRMNDVHYSKQTIEEIILNKKVVWLVTESKLNFINNKSEWTGTKIIFDISEINNKTQLRFTHEGLVPAFECYGGCSNAWEQLIQESLRSLITIGKGTNVFG